MLPSEKAERFIRRVGYAALILIALFILVWFLGFISRIFRQVMEQREAPEEARALPVQVG